MKINGLSRQALCTLSFYIWNMCGHHIPQSALKIPDLGHFSFPVAPEVISPLRLCVCVLPTRACTSVQIDWESECLQPSAKTGTGAAEKLMFIDSQMFK